nr:interleukin-27 receptor subunit alpha [Camelus dromedarius]
MPWTRPSGDFPAQRRGWDPERKVRRRGEGWLRFPSPLERWPRERGERRGRAGPGRAERHWGARGAMRGPGRPLPAAAETGAAASAVAAVPVDSAAGHSNKIWTVTVPTGQSWVTIPREQLTTSDELLVWAVKAGQPLWPPVFVNLETRMKPDAPRLGPDVDFSEDDPLEATVQWAPPLWPPHKVLVCQFYYRRCQERTWILLEPEVKSIPLTPIEIQDLDLATAYEMSGHCQVEKEKDLWGEWSPILSFQTPPSAPKDVWISGNICGASGGQELLLLWKASGHCVQVEWASVSAVNATIWEPPTNLSLACLGPGFGPCDVVVRSIAGSTELLVTWQQGSGELWEHVVDWARDGDPLEDLNWVRLPPGKLSAVLPGDFEGGVPYRITVTAVTPWGLAPSPSVWKFREELAPLAGPVLWRLQDSPPGTPAVAWEEVPRHQLRGHLTHYTLCARSGTRPSVCMNVSGSTQTITLPDLPWGPCELWVTASTIAGQGPPGPSLRFHLPDNTLKWKVLPGVLLLWVLLLTGCGLSLAASGRCVHLRHKVLPQWAWEKVPDPANRNFSLPNMEEVPQAQPPGDSPILEVEEMEQVPVVEPPQTLAPLDSGYEKHFLPTPEELGLLGPTPGSRFWPENIPGGEKGAHLTDEDTEAQRG